MAESSYDIKTIKKAIKHHYEIISSNLRAGSITPTLYSKDVITLIEKQLLDCTEKNQGTIVQSQVLLDKMLVKSDGLFTIFLEVLKEKQQGIYDEIMNITKAIQNGKITVSDNVDDSSYIPPGLGIVGMELTLDEIKDPHFTVTWKQGSFFGLGGDMSQKYQFCSYKNENGAIFPVFVHSSMGKPQIIKPSRNLQYGLNNGQVFLVYHDKEKYKPFQHRFVRNDWQNNLYSGNEWLLQALNLDVSSVYGDYLRDVL